MQNLTKTNLPLVSVLVTAYNRENYISETIDSILSSTYTNFELIVVDDHSIDRTYEIAISYIQKDLRVRVYRNEKNIGDYPNRNKAVTYAKGKYIKYVDSDDYIYPDTLEYMVSEMEKYPLSGFGLSSRLSSNTKVYSPREAYLYHFFSKGILDLGPTALIINKTRFDEIGGFDHIRNVSDYDFCLRMASLYQVVEMKQGLVYWRTHPEQEIRLDPSKYLEYGLQILKKSLLNENCPLDESEVSIILRKFKKIYAKDILKSFLRTFDFQKCIHFWRSNQLSVFDLFR